MDSIFLMPTAVGGWPPYLLKFALKVAPNHIFGISEARHFKFHVHIEQRSTSACMIDYPQKGCVQGYVNSQFWEISGNISEMVQDRQSCSWRLIGNRMWPISGPIMSYLQWPWRSLYLFETFVSILRGGSRPWWCAGRAIRGVINNTGGSRRWLIAGTVQLTSPRLVMWKSVGTCTALHAPHCSLCDS